MFINVGKFYKITQLVIQMDRYSGVKFYFGNRYFSRTIDLNLTAKQAREFIKLFRVPSLKITAPSDCGHEFDEYWPLIDCVEGKLFYDYYLKSNFKAKSVWISRTIIGTF
jgi:hypothetical protein